MNKSLYLLSAIVFAVVISAFNFFDVVPTSVPTAVIGEKPNGTVGNQVVVKLPENLTLDQSRMLALAYEFAKSDGHQSPELVQGVLLQETRAGGMDSFRVANPGPEAYFGPMQIKLATAKDVLKRHPALYTKYKFHTRTDDEIRAHLILNDRFNLEVGSKYLLMLQNEFGFRGRQLMNAYNRGPGGVHAVDDSFHYAVGAERKLAKFKSQRS